MIRFPKHFVKIKYPGYFWDVKEEILYSIKIGGELKPLKLKKAYYGPGKTGIVDIPEGYSVSVNGQKKIVALSDLQKLTYSESIIEMVDMK